MSHALLLRRSGQAWGARAAAASPSLSASRALGRGRQARALSTGVVGANGRQRGAAAAAAVAVAATGATALLLVLASPHGEEGGAACGAGKVAHTLFVAGSTSGRGMRETVVGVPKEVALPGPPGAIDGVAFGPSWVAVATQGAVYVSTAVGSGGVGQGEVLTLHEPRRGWFGGGESVVQVACGRDTIYGRTSKGTLLYWTRRPGEAEDPVLRFDGPYRYSQLARAKVTHIAAGPEHAVFLTEAGEAYGLGNNADGRVGVGTAAGGLDALVSAPTLLRIPAGRKIVGASCGSNHTLLLDSEGGAYSCGSDYWYQLAHGETWKVTKDRADTVILEPKKVRQFEEVAVAGVAAGGSHSLFSLVFPGHWVERGAFDERIRTPARVQEVWAAGFGQYGQLGDRAYVHLSPPKAIRELRTMTYPDVLLPAIQVACGENHSAALLLEPVTTLSKSSTTTSSSSSSSDGDSATASRLGLTTPPPPRDKPLTYRRQIYVWGHNLGAQCGTGKPGNLAKPTVPQVVNPSLIDAIVCGFDFTGFVQRQQPAAKQQQP